MAAALGQVDYGSDVSTYPDLDPSFAPLTGTRVIAEAIARRLSTVRGSIPDAPNYGTDIRGFLLDSFGMVGTGLTQMKNAIERECLQDERVSAVDAALYFDAKNGTMNVTVMITAAQGPSFKLVLAVTAVTITLLATG